MKRKKKSYVRGDFFSSGWLIIIIIIIIVIIIIIIIITIAPAKDQYGCAYKLLPYCMCFIDVPVSVGLPTPVASVAMPPK
jgi:uncharacterized BrkB/YihY/UPF0761 family membrane protein